MGCITEENWVEFDRNERGELGAWDRGAGEGGGNPTDENEREGEGDGLDGGSGGNWAGDWNWDEDWNWDGDWSRSDWSKFPNLTKFNLLNSAFHINNQSKQDPFHHFNSCALLLNVNLPMLPIEAKLWALLGFQRLLP